jgi:6-phosphogluconolactonase
MPNQVHIYRNENEFSAAVAIWMISLIEDRLKSKSKFCLLLSGGNTPKRLYELLAAENYRDKIDWSRIVVFFGDERVVPFNDARNNGRMAFDSLLCKVPIPKEQIHFIDTTNDSKDSADSYARILHHYFDSQSTSFDLAFLGMGDDGHTLSIFPGSQEKLDLSKWVISLYLPSQQMYRVSLTPAIVNKSYRVALLVTGSAKAKVLEQILSHNAPRNMYPVQLIAPVNGELHWFLDEAAMPIGNGQ